MGKQTRLPTIRFLLDSGSIDDACRIWGKLTEIGKLIGFYTTDEIGKSDWSNRANSSDQMVVNITMFQFCALESSDRRPTRSLGGPRLVATPFLTMMYFLVPLVKTITHTKKRKTLNFSKLRLKKYRNKLFWVNTDWYELSMNSCVGIGYWYPAACITANFGWTYSDFCQCLTRPNKWKEKSWDRNL